MRLLSVVLCALSLCLLGADCSFEDLIDPEDLGIPDPCDAPEIACNGIDEDCDGVDECAAPPEGYEDLLNQALAVLELDCDGIDASLTAALGPLGLGGDVACPSEEVVAEGPLWDGVETCEDDEGGTCTRSGSASTSTWTGGCDRDDDTIAGSLVLSEGALTVDVTTDAETRTEAAAASTFVAAVPDGMSIAAGGETQFRVTGDADASSTVVTRTDPADASTTTTENRSCSLNLGLQSATLPAPLGTSTLARVQVARSAEDGAVVDWTDARNGNLTGEAVDGGVPSASWVRDQEGDGENCAQSGSVEVWVLDLESTSRRWTVKLELDAPCMPCGDLTVDGDYAGRWCDGALLTP